MAKPEKDIKVLIVGAGPAGLMTACQLALFNIPFRIIDKKSSPSNYSGALIIHAKTLELLQQLELADTALKPGTQINALSIYFAEEKIHRLELKNTGKNLSQFTSMLMLEQAKTEELLLQFLRKKDCFVEWETELTDLTEQPDKIAAVLQLPDGRSETAVAQYLVAADGGQSTVRRLLKIPFHGKTHQPDLCIMECKTDMTLTENEICFAFSKKATAGFFPLPGGRWRIDAALQKTPNNPERLTFDAVKKDFEKEIKMNVHLQEASFYSVFNSHGKFAEKFSTSRSFLVGDAAHLFTPVGAQGMNTGMQDAQNLAWKLAFVIQNKFKPEILNSYEQERKPLAKKTAKSTSFFFKMVASGNRMYKIFRNYGLKYVVPLFLLLMKKPHFNNRIFSNISGIGFRYKKNALILNNNERFKTSAPKPGQRLPFFSYTAGGTEKNIREQVQPTKFHLLIFSKEKSAVELLKQIEQWQEILSAEVITYSPETEKLYAEFGIQNGGWFLVRPDFHVACRSAKMSAARLENYFQKQTIEA